MTWVVSHEDLGQHPKVHALMSSLKIRLPEAVGILHLLWHFTMKFSWRDGDLSKFNTDFIAKAVGWDEDSGKLIKSLQQTGWMDGMIVHDWLEHAGKIVQDRIYNQERRKTALNAVKNGVNYGATSPVSPTSRTSPTSKKREGRFAPPTHEQVSEYAKSLGKTINAKKFCDHHETNGWMRGKTKIKSWKAAVSYWIGRDDEENTGKQGRLVI